MFTIIATLKRQHDNVVGARVRVLARENLKSSRFVLRSLTEAGLTIAVLKSRCDSYAMTWGASLLCGYTTGAEPRLHLYIKDCMSGVC